MLYEFLLKDNNYKVIITQIVEVMPIISVEELNRLKTALSEVLSNSFEHGVLGITAEEKASFLAAGVWEEEVKNRVVMNTRFVRISVNIEGRELNIVVNDFGNGFEPNSTTKIASDSLNGRGLKIIYHYFDSVEFNDVGNEIRGTKKLSS